MPTKAIVITAGQDVASVGWDTDHWYFIVDPADCDLGWVSNAINRQGNALRFLDIPIPPGSIILYAYLKYCAFSNYIGDVVRAYIRAEKNPLPYPFTTYANYIARPRTTNKSDWSDIPHWFLNVRYNSIDFTSVIQEVIDQPTWQQGFPIAVFCEDHDDRSDHLIFCTRHAKAYHIEPTKAPRLHLSWISPTDIPPPASAGETYTRGGDTLHKCDNPNWAGQTFTPGVTHTLQYIDLQMRGPLVIPTPVVLVFNADAHHKPWGEYLSRNRYIIEQHCSLFTTGRVRFSMTPVELVKGFKYVIIVENYPPLLGSSAYWQYDQGDAGYPGGLRISTNNSGADWTVHYNDDHLFAEFGTPPLPKPEPPPPIDPFALIDIWFLHALTYIMITSYTATPCHLTLYHTDNQPRRHHSSRIVRGLSVPWGVYFCFVAWTAVEQLEAGDTLWHTFIVGPWAYCDVKWFTIRGEVDDILSPSVGPIFKHHHSGVTSTLFEHYIVNDDTGHIVWKSLWQAQTFIPTIPHTISAVWIKAYRVGNPGTITVGIRDTIAGVPTDTDLCLDSIDGNSITLDPGGEWVKIEISPGINLLPDVQYAIAIRISSIIPLNYLVWRADGSAPAYTSGMIFQSADSGNTWAPAPLTDFMFEEWGFII